MLGILISDTEFFLCIHLILPTFYELNIMTLKKYGNLNVEKIHK